MDGVENLVEAKRNENQGMVRLVFALVIISLMVSTIAIILSATSLSKEGTTINVGDAAGSTGGSSAGKLADDVWTFAIGHDGSNVEYLDRTSGTLRGFHVDIVNAVCAQANKNCRLVWDVYGNCWNSRAGEQARGGPGLMGGWYDACTGWFNTYERAITFKFTNPLRKKINGQFVVKQGNPSNFDPTSIGSTQKLGFGDGWSTDEHCLARNSDTISGVPLDSSQVVHYSTREQLIAAILNDEVVAGFSNAHTLLDSGLQQIGPDITNCQRAGGSIMTRMQSTLPDWWNPAFDALKANGAYKDICAKIDNEHGSQRGFAGDVVCLD
ncbi:uncharacterized protein LOC755972 [Strongylocentrotus purpuratus]|uniref:Solute-binding protein family 3/N-terminal domain-containing protein n=1 Tax=Strongylocentrotus purpuratus TaxID=7668 RepID=A0A7M7G140_STRPU|nr:uncharacterized protein LOC755972 [Strongylocentrotus purpuratus]|eukprot:XP_001192880.2 PREDICTED: uncharacterized protein LOC755972 [Strongylocentrotus purpuratus]